MTHPVPHPAPYPVPAYAHPAAPRRRRPVGLMVAVALATAVLLCVGGASTAFLVVRDAQPRGAADPAEAIDGFLSAVFRDHSADAAAGYVCGRARDDEELGRLIQTVREFQDRYEEPTMTWEHPPVRASDGRAAATVTLTLTTANEQVASKRIRLLLVEDRGWWVCDVEAAL